MEDAKRKTKNEKRLRAQHSKRTDSNPCFYAAQKYTLAKTSVSNGWAGELRSRVKSSCQKDKRLDLVNNFTTVLLIIKNTVNDNRI